MKPVQTLQHPLLFKPIQAICLRAWRKLWGVRVSSSPLQALFRKIAAALPGMESLSASKQEDLVDINLAPAGGQNKAGSGQSAASQCAC